MMKSPADPNNPFVIIMQNLQMLAQGQNQNAKQIQDLLKRMEQLEAKGVINTATIKNEDPGKSLHLQQLIEKAKNSIVEIYISGKQESHVIPGVKRPISGKGSGFIIEHNGEMKIITNSHVISGASNIEVRLVNGTKRYPAKVKRNGTKCDLARLEVEDKEFWDNVKPLTLKEKYKLGSDAIAMGFPIGGDELSVTSGAISRNVAGHYAHSGQIFKEIQISAPINPGNSGGPVIHEEEGNLYVIGVVHQGLTKGQNIGYMIPANIVEHFLKLDMDQDYKGFPHFYIEWQELENDFQREQVFGLKPNQTGILINEVPKLSSAFNILQENDILTKINGMSIDNRGNLQDPKTGSNIPFIAQIRDYDIGEELTLTIVRDKKELDLKVKLKNPIGQLEMIETKYNSPTYYMNSNLTFSLLTENFINEIKIAYPALLEKISKLKEDYNEEVVIITDVISGKSTKGYDFCKYNIVNEINGKKINNIKDVINAMENNEANYHTIRLQGNLKSTIHVEKISDIKQYMDMMESSGRLTHCSDDLKEYSSLMRKLSKNNDEDQSKIMEQLLFRVKNSDRLDRIESELRKRENSQTPDSPKEEYNRPKI